MNENTAFTHLQTQKRKFMKKSRWLFTNNQNPLLEPWNGKTCTITQSSIVFTNGIYYILWKYFCGRGKGWPLGKKRKTKAQGAPTPPLHATAAARRFYVRWGGGNRNTQYIPLWIPVKIFLMVMGRSPKGESLPPSRLKPSPVPSFFRFTVIGLPRGTSTNFMSRQIFVYWL